MSPSPSRLRYLLGFEPYLIILRCYLRVLLRYVLPPIASIISLSNSPLQYHNTPENLVQLQTCDSKATTVYLRLPVLDEELGKVLGVLQPLYFQARHPSLKRSTQHMDPSVTRQPFTGQHTTVRTSVWL